MIIFHSTKSIGNQSFMVFTNEAGALIQIPVQANILSMFLHHFDRLSPGIKTVEPSTVESSQR